MIFDFAALNKKSLATDVARLLISLVFTSLVQTKF